jgi:uncharacterized protein (DUF2237 family)
MIVFLLFKICKLIQYALIAHMICSQICTQEIAHQKSATVQIADTQNPYQLYDNIV